VNGVAYGDWFLPAKGELNQMYVNRVAIGGFSPFYYWSSSEVNATSAWSHGFNGGGPQHGTKFNTDFVRPVRAF
jgi:hypothetical protein